MESRSWVSISVSHLAMLDMTFIGARELPSLGPGVFDVRLWRNCVVHGRHSQVFEVAPDLAGTNSPLRCTPLHARYHCQLLMSHL